MAQRNGTCIDCGTGFAHEAKGGPVPQRCPECRVLKAKTAGRERQYMWRLANPERAREHYNKSNRKRLASPEHLRRKREDAVRRAYGLEPSQLEALLSRQNGRCAVCGGLPNGPGRRLHIDHCHATKRTRGLLCSKCNTLLGLADDDPVRLETAAAYLRAHM